MLHQFFQYIYHAVHYKFLPLSSPYWCVCVVRVYYITFYNIVLCVGKRFAELELRLILLQVLLHNRLLDLDSSRRFRHGRGRGGGTARLTKDASTLGGRIHEHMGPGKPSKSEIFHYCKVLIRL